MASKTIFAAVAVAVIAVAGSGAWYQHKAKSAPAQRAGAEGAPRAGAGGGAPTLVTIATAMRQDVPVTVEVNGTVVSLNSVDVRSQVSNIVKKVHVKEGQFVKAGETLFSLDDRADRANLEKARAQRQRDLATLADLERQYRRSQELLAQNFISKSAADNTLSQVDAQRAAVASDEAAIQAAQVALSYDTIV
jgi:RND family efflux transporter MFP subunit